MLTTTKDNGFLCLQIICRHVYPWQKPQIYDSNAKETTRKYLSVTQPLYFCNSSGDITSTVANLLKFAIPIAVRLCCLPKACAKTALQRSCTGVSILNTLYWCTSTLLLTEYFSERDLCTCDLYIFVWSFI